MAERSDRTCLSAPRTLTELFQRAVLRQPAAPAVRDDEGALSYAQVAALAEGLAGELRRRGIGPEDRVAVHLPRADAIVAVLGVLHAGAAYLPVDIRYPDERRDAMLADGSVSAVLTAPGHAEHLAHLGIPTIEWSRRPAPGAGRAPSAPLSVAPVSVAPEAAACVLYTGDSAGRPRGVVLEHHHLVALALNRALPPLTPDDRTGQLASISHDRFNLELWCSIAGGAEMVILPALPDLLAADIDVELRSRGITAILLSATAINEIVSRNRDALAPLRLLYSCGEALLPRVRRQIFSGAFTGRLISLYGTAETSTACAAYEVTATEPGPTGEAIGRPFEGVDLYVLDADRRPVPDGAPGQLFVGGTAVARGYLDRPELTGQRFLADPFRAGEGTMYATGDRVVWRHDGVLEHLGHLDAPAKIRGYPVEPFEVERLLCEYPEVRDAAVVATGPADARRLVGFLVTTDTLRLDDLFRALRRDAPEHLVPSEIMVLPTLPTDGRGKRDLDVLSRLADEGHTRDGDGRDEHWAMELASLWQDLPAAEPVEVYDNVGASGGCPPLAVRAHEILPGLRGRQRRRAPLATTSRR